MSLVEQIEQYQMRLRSLERENKHLRNENATISDALHKMGRECSAMVIQAQRHHLRCANEHGCPQEYVTDDS